MLRCKICGFVINSNDYATECPICHTAGWCDYYLTEIKKINADEKFVNAMMELREKDLLNFKLRCNNSESNLLIILPVKTRPNPTNPVVPNVVQLLFPQVLGE